MSTVIIVGTADSTITTLRLDVSVRFIASTTGQKGANPTPVPPSAVPGTKSAAAAVVGHEDGGLSFDLTPMETYRMGGSAPASSIRHSYLDESAWLATCSAGHVAVRRST
jgi:hypothetical protein